MVQIENLIPSHIFSQWNELTKQEKSNMEAVQQIFVVYFPLFIGGNISTDRR